MSSIFFEFYRYEENYVLESKAGTSKTALFCVDFKASRLSRGATQGVFRYAATGEGKTVSEYDEGPNCESLKRDGCDDQGENQNQVLGYANGV